MVTQKAVIKNLTGLNVHPAGVLCETAARFKSEISLCIGNTTVNAKSVLGVLGAGVRNGDEIELVCKGSDEEEALQTVIRIIEEGLGE